MTEGRITSYQRGDLHFDVLDEGPADGPVVVLLHGFPQLNTSWAKVALLLHEQGFRTLAPNQRGYSPGARPRGRKPYKVSEMVKDTVALIERSGGPVHLVGHDWGAAVAWAAAIMHPEAVRTLTAVSVPHPGAFMKAMPRGQLLDSWYMVAFNLPWLPERALTNRRVAERFLRGFGGMRSEVFETYWRDFHDVSSMRGALAWYRALPLANPKLFGVKAQVPTTYLWSDRDGALSRAAAELCEHYVDAPYRFEILQGASHWLPDERPAELARAILDRARSAG